MFLCSTDAILLFPTIISYPQMIIVLCIISVLFYDLPTKIPTIGLDATIPDDTGCDRSVEIARLYDTR